MKQGRVRLGFTNLAAYNTQQGDCRVGSPGLCAGCMCSFFGGGRARARAGRTSYWLTNNTRCASSCTWMSASVEVWWEQLAWQLTAVADGLIGRSRVSGSKSVSALQCLAGRHTRSRLLVAVATMAGARHYSRGSEVEWGGGFCVGGWRVRGGGGGCTAAGARTSARGSKQQQEQQQRGAVHATKQLRCSWLYLAVYGGECRGWAHGGRQRRASQRAEAAAKARVSIS